jgi:hypothetical protein
MMSKHQAQTPLADRLAIALRNDAPSEVIVTLIAEAEDARSTAEEQRQ